MIAITWWMTFGFPLLPSFCRYPHTYTQRALYTQLSRLPVPRGRYPGNCLMVQPLRHTTLHDTTPHHTS